MAHRRGRYDWESGWWEWSILLQYSSPAPREQDLIYYEFCGMLRFPANGPSVVCATLVCNSQLQMWKINTSTNIQQVLSQWLFAMSGGPSTNFALSQLFHPISLARYSIETLLQMAECFRHISNISEREKICLVSLTSDGSVDAPIKI